MCRYQEHGDIGEENSGACRGLKQPCLAPDEDVEQAFKKVALPISSLGPYCDQYGGGDGGYAEDDEMPRILEVVAVRHEGPDGQANQCQKKKCDLAGKPFEDNGLGGLFPPTVLIAAHSPGSQRITTHAARQGLVQKAGDVVFPNCRERRDILAKTSRREAPSQRREHDLHLYQREATYDRGPGDARQRLCKTRQIGALDDDDQEGQRGDGHEYSQFVQARAPLYFACFSNRILRAGDGSRLQ